MLGTAVSGFQIGTGVNQVSEGQTLEGSLNIAEGGIQTGINIVGAMEGVAAIPVIAAAGTITWAFTDTRRALAGEPTLTEEAIDYWREFGESLVY